MIKMVKIIIKYFKVRNFHKTNCSDFTIFWKICESLKYFEIFDLVAFTKVNSRENVQFFRPDSISCKKIFFFSKSL